MRNSILLLAGAAFLAGCGGGGGGGFEVPGFLGREGNATGFFNPRGEATPDPVPLPVEQAVVERSLYGAILRVSGPSPTQGFWGAELRPLSEGPDEKGVLAFEFLAIPPADAENSGAPATRTMSAGAFIPTITARKTKSVQVRGTSGVQTLNLPAMPKA